MQDTGRSLTRAANSPVLLVVAGHDRRLQRRDHVRVVHVVLAVVHVLEQAALLDASRLVPGALRQVVGIGLQVRRSPRPECGSRSPRSTVPTTSSLKPTISNSCALR